MSFLKSAFFALITMGFALLAKAGPIPLPEKGAFVGAYTNSGPNADEVSADSIFEFESQIGKN